MENYQSEWNEQEEPAAKPEKPISPFADSPYESAYRPADDLKPVKQKKKCFAGKRIISTLLVAAIVLVSCGVTAACVSAFWSQKMQSVDNALENKLNVMQSKLEAMQGTGASSTTAGSESSLTLGQVYAQNVQAVVAISNQGQTTNIFGQVSQTASSGSGFIISADGYVVSNYHVVEGATKLSVITWDGQEYAAELIGYDASNDLAVLKIEGNEFPFVKLGSSDALVVGDQVAAIGNPLGELTSTLTAGYISAKNRSVSTSGSYMNMLQTDAAINSGNSGGPLFNMNGEVVGITTAKYTGTSNSGATIEGIGFAIPIDDVVGMIADLTEKGYVSGAYLGVMVRDMDTSVAQMYGLPIGVYVEEVTPGSCAQTAGIQAKDIIIDLAGHEIGSMAELTRVLRDLEPGEATTVTVYRGGSQVHLDITLDEKPQETQTQQQTQQQPETQTPAVTPDQDYFSNWFGSFFPGFGG